MVSSKNHAAALLAALLTLLVMAASPVAQVLTWETITSFRDVRRLAVIDDTLYAATSGGLLQITDFGAPARTFLHTDGLGTTDLHDLVVDRSGTPWLAGFGRLIRFDDLASQPFLIFDTDNNLLPVYSLADDGDNLWVGTGIGLVLFSKVNDGGQIEDSYILFGDLNPSPQVRDVELVADSLWLATTAGLAVGDAANPVELKSPLAWTTFDIATNPELGTDTITRVAAFDNDIYIGTSRGTFVLRRDIDTTFSVFPETANRRVYDLVVTPDTLFCYFSGGLAAITAGGVLTALGTDGLPAAPQTGTTYGDTRWVAAVDSGLYRSVGTAYQVYPYGGAPANDVRSITFGHGLLTAGFGDRVYAQYDGDNWTVAPFNAVDGTMDLLADNSGNTWAASWGNGLWRLSGDDLVNYDETNSTLLGILGAPSYVVVRSLATDGVNIFASLFQALNGDVVAFAPIAAVDNPAAWGSFGIAEGLNNDLVSSIAFGRGQLAVATTGNGVFLCDLGSDPYSGTTPRCVHYTEENSRLISNEVRVVQYSPFGNVWVGTNFGISRWDPGIERFVDVNPPPAASSEVRSIVFDGRGKAWGGTRGGLVRFDATVDDTTVFRTGNSDLVADQITDLWLDRSAGDLYAATPAGISILRTSIERFTTQLDSIVPVPNPFVIRSSDDRLNFNYDAPATVTLYTVAGERIAEYPVNRPWDGRNDRGREAASGVYLYVITDESGEIARGKILLIRK